LFRLWLWSRLVSLSATLFLREGRSQEVVNLFVVYQPKLPQEFQVNRLPGQFLYRKKVIYLLQHLRVIDFLQSFSGFRAKAFSNWPVCSA